MGLFDLVSRLLGSSADDIITKVSRSFPGPNLFAQIRRRPCTALLRMMHHRLSGWSDLEIAARISQSHHQLSLLPPTIYKLGAAAPYHNYWVCPLLALDNKAAQTALRRRGIDSTVSASQLFVVPVPASLQADERRAKAAQPLNAQHLMAHIFYVPTYEGVPLWATHRVADVLHRACLVPPPPPPRGDRPRARL
jgi:hypothetical protein